MVLLNCIVILTGVFYYFVLPTYISGFRLKDRNTCMNSTEKSKSEPKVPLQSLFLFTSLVPDIPGRPAGCERHPGETSEGGQPADGLSDLL